MDEQTDVSFEIVEEPSPNLIHIKIKGYEDILPTYPIADLTMKVEFLGQVLGESETTPALSNIFIESDYEVIIPCDLSSHDDLDKYISNPVIITVIELPREVDMSTVEVSVKERPVTEVEQKGEAETVVDLATPTGSTVFKGKDKGKGKDKAKGKDKEKSKSKESIIKKESKVKVLKDIGEKNVNPDAPPPPTGPLVFGIATLDLLPIFLGKTEFGESLPLQQALPRLDDRAIPVKLLPRLQVSILVDGPLFNEHDTSVLNISVESIYNLPNLVTSEYQYQMCFMLPDSTRKLAPVVMAEGKYMVEKNVDNFKCWPIFSETSGPIRTKYRISDDFCKVKNKLDIDLETVLNEEKPRIEWNTLKRNFLPQTRLEAVYKQIKKYRRIPIEIFITPKKEEDDPDQAAADKNKSAAKGAKKKDKGSTAKKDGGKGEPEPDESPDYLHLMCIADVGSLLYPGINSCRLVCPLRTYQEKEIFMEAGQEDSYYRPRPPPVEEVPETGDGKQKGKGKGDKDKKGDSKASSKSGDSKKGKGKKGVGEESGPVDLAQGLPPPPPPEPDPSLTVYDDQGLSTFLLLEIEFIKPLHPPRTLEDLSKHLSIILPAKPAMSKRLISSKIATEMYNESLRTIVEDMNYQYHQYLKDKNKCKCHEVIDFLAYLRQSGTYQTYLATINKATAILVREHYSYDGEVGRLNRYYQMFIAEVYADMVNRMNTVINEMVTCNVEKPQNNVITADDYLLYAKEVTELGAPNIADRYYLERICCDEENASHWFDYAVFHMEMDSEDKATQALKETLAIDPSHRYSLMMYGLLLSKKGKVVEAETCLLTMSLLQPRWVEGWVVLYFFYKKMKNEEGMDVTMEMATKYLNDPGVVKDYFIDDDDLAWSTETCTDGVFLRSACLLIKMRLFEDAERVLACAMVEKKGECEYLLAVMCYYRQEFDHALEHLWLAKQLIGFNCGMSGLIGHCLTKLKNTNGALKHYERALEMYNRPEDIHMIYLYSALAYDTTGDSQKARKLALLACKHSPTPQTWMHAGGYYFKQNDLLSAEECLMQANLCDNRLPDVWGYLALINAHLGKEHECQMCLVQAKKFHLNDKQLLNNIEEARNEFDFSVKQ